MDISVLKDYFNRSVTFPAYFKPEPAMTAHNVKRFIRECFREIEYENQLQRIKDIRLEWLIKLKNQMESQTEDCNPENLYIIGTSRNIKDCFKLPFEEYEALRNKIKSKLLEFYEIVEVNDASIKSYDINFYCKIGDHGAMQYFNVEEWITIERSGQFAKEYSEKLKSIKFQPGWAKQKASHF